MKKSNKKSWLKQLILKEKNVVNDKTIYKIMTERRKEFSKTDEEARKH